MSGGDIAIALTERETLGKGLNKLRAEGLVPAVIHDHGKDSIHVSAPAMVIGKVYSQAGKHHPVNITIGSEKHLALIKDVDFEPTKRRIRHVVFQAIKQNETVQAEIPLVLTEDIPAERASLMVITSLDVIQVEALPKNLPDQLVVDATTLVDVGDKITVADITVPADVTILTDPETAIAVVEMPKDQIAEADAAAADLAADAAASADEEETVETEAATDNKTESASDTGSEETDPEKS
jgi:large subunit ribosomal protein L25